MRGASITRDSPPLPAISDSLSEPCSAATSCTVTAIARAPRRPSEASVFVDDRLEERLVAVQREQPGAEVLVLQEPRDAGERLQVHRRGVVGRDEDEEQVRRQLVDRIEVDSLAAAREA